MAPEPGRFRRELPEQDDSATPPVLLQKIYGELDNLAPAAKKAKRLRGIIGASLGPKVAWGKRNYSLVGLEGTASIDTTMRMAGQLELTIWNEYFRALDALAIIDQSYGFYGELDINVLKLLEGEGRFRVDSQSKLQGSLHVALEIPRKVPYVGGIEVARVGAGQRYWRCSASASCGSPGPWTSARWRGRRGQDLMAQIRQ